MINSKMISKTLVKLNTKGSTAILFALVISLIFVSVHLGIGVYINSVAQTSKRQAEQQAIESSQANALTIVSKLMGTGLIENKNGMWISNLSKSPNSAAYGWTFNPATDGSTLASPGATPPLGSFAAVGFTSLPDEIDDGVPLESADPSSTPASKPKIAVKLCDLSALTASNRTEIFGAGHPPSDCVALNSEAEISDGIANGKTDIQLTTFPSSNADDSPGIPKILKARIRTSIADVSGPGPVIATCQPVQSISSLNILYQTLLGRDMNSTEAVAITDCISQGKIYPDELESSRTDLCGGLRGLRAMPEYSKQLEVINSLYQLFLDRLPNDADTINIAKYRALFGLDDKVYSSTLKLVINKIKSDYSLKFNPTLQISSLQKYYDLLYDGAKTISDVDPNIKDLAAGTAIFSSLRGMQSGNLIYNKRGRLTGERISFLYHSLFDKQTPANILSRYIRLMNFGKTDPVLQPLEWLAQDFRSSEEYSALGGCAVAPPRPQIRVKIVSTQLSSWEGYQTSEDRCIKLTMPVKDSTLPVKNVCPTGTLKRKVMLPNSVDKPIYKKTATAFGNFSELQFEGSTKTFDPLLKTVYNFPDISLPPSSAGLTITTSGTVKGPTGENSSTDTRLAEVHVPITIINKLSAVWGRGPESTYKVDSESTKNLAWHDVLYPAPALIFTNNTTELRRDKSHAGHAGEVDVSPADISAYVQYRRYFYWGFSDNLKKASFYTDTFPGSPSSAGLTPPSTVIPEVATRDDYKLTVDGFSYMLRYNGSTWGSDWVQHFSSDYSPLVIDLNQEGVKLSHPDMGTLFDLEGKGKKSIYSWIENPKSISFIAYDKNHNGRIDDIHELFGDNTQGPDAKTAENGFESLIKYDANRDLSIDAKDSIFDSLLLWSDLNKNGVSEPNELSALSLSGVKSLDLNYDGVTEVNDRYGNLTHGRSVAIMNDESMRTIHDIWFVEGSTARPQASIANR